MPFISPHPVIAATSAFGLPVFWEALLDLIGVMSAIWTVWALAWLPVEGMLRSAFRFITIGSLTFALLHVSDTVLRQGRLLPGSLVSLIHIGSMLLAMIFFVLGLARLADAVTWEKTAERPPLRWWPFSVGVALCLGLLSFIIYGLSASAVVWATVGISAGLVLLTAVCLVQVLRARLGGMVGSALWLALIGLVVFCLVHPLQSWLFDARIIVPSPISPVLHRLFVIPAFLLFSASIARLSRGLASPPSQAPRPALLNASAPQMK